MWRHDFWLSFTSNGTLLTWHKCNPGYQCPGLTALHLLLRYCFYSNWRKQFGIVFVHRLSYHFRRTRSIVSDSQKNTYNRSQNDTQYMNVEEHQRQAYGTCGSSSSHGCKMVTVWLEPKLLNRIQVFTWDTNLLYYVTRLPPSLSLRPHKTTNRHQGRSEDSSMLTIRQFLSSFQNRSAHHLIAKTCNS